jgi:tetratricopeptide (TPR) repeat protein
MELAESSDQNSQIAGLLSLASVYSQKGSIEFKEVEYGMKALEAANQVLALAGDNADAYREIGYANEIMQKYDEAIKAYEKAAVLNPQDANIYSNMGHAYSLMGDNKKAEENYLKAVALGGTSVHTLYNLARLSYSRGDLAKAEEYARQTISDSNNLRFSAEAHDLLGLINLSAENFSEAVNNFNLAVSLDPKLAGAYVHLASAKIKVVTSKMLGGDLIGFRTSRDQALVEALSLVEKALTINPGLTIAFIAKAELLSLNAKYDEALSALVRASVSVGSDITLSSIEKVGIQKEIEVRTGIINSLKTK